ncbi:class I SAM-dependent methyltransferase [Aestuariivita boseongensis]|uniref:class I SAM-dependent methyltransferase n=1 Tax=Aestuariivita boseongensis TaxID=1470562 RepID=UPI000682086A|nr:class I SAM-dependent methyltransferase [Aestuariivita boseongensis]
MDDRSFVAAQDVILDMKKHWTTRLYPALKAEYAEKAAGSAPSSRHDVAELLQDSTTYRFFGWMERHLQRMKYSGPYGLDPYHKERSTALTGSLPDMSDDLRLELNPDFENPVYYETVDVHQHPGGVWSDAVSGFIYERGARSTTPMLGEKHRDMHGRLTDRAIRDGVPERMLDMGCGFGKSTRPFWEELRDTQVEAVDLAAPCLTLAAADAAQAQAENVRFRQMSAYETDYDDHSFDLVTSTMLLHEMPPEEIGKTFDECARVLKPGGRMVHLDFYILPDPFAEFIHYGHSRRNNEPFMVPLAEMDVRAELEARGFTNISIEPFQEAEGIDTENSPYWRFPWTIIAAERA